MYDFLIVGAGLFGSIFAYEASKKHKCLVIDKRPHIGGNTYCEKVEGINVHKYGAHIFHTSSQKVWDYMNTFVEFNHFRNSPLANYKGELYNLPFNMNTFYQLWKVKTPEEAQAKIKEQLGAIKVENPQNLEEQALVLVGPEIYEKLIKGYTEKQWGRRAIEIPAFIIKRLPLRFVFDNNYFNDKYQGIPIGGYNVLIEKMLSKCEVELNVDFLMDRERLSKIADKVVFTGEIDRFYNYIYGPLAYRSLKFDNKILDTPNFQGNAVINYTDLETPYTRIIEHKHFEFGQQEKTVVSYEYPCESSETNEPYYPINDSVNNEIYKKYHLLALKEKNVIFGGRLAEYKYYDMHIVVERVLNLWS